MFENVKFLGPRLLIVSIFGIIESMYEINVLMISGVYFGLFPNVNAGTQYFYYYFRNERQMPKESTARYFGIFHEREVPAVYLLTWMITAFMLLFINFMLMAISTVPKFLNRSTALVVLIPWMCVTVVCNIIRIPMLFKMFEFASYKRDIFNMEYNHFIEHAVHSPYSHGNAEYMMVNMVGYFSLYYSCFVLPLTAISLAVIIADCTLLWKRTLSELNVCRIPTQEDEEIFDDLEASTVEESVVDFYFNLTQAPRKRGKSRLQFAVDDEADDNRISTMVPNRFSRRSGRVSKDHEHMSNISSVDSRMSTATLSYSYGGSVQDIPDSYDDLENKENS